MEEKNERGIHDQPGAGWADRNLKTNANSRAIFLSLITQNKTTSLWA
jgi:hypothetical protein